MAASLSIELVPKITVRGENGTVQSLEWSSTVGVGGKWQVLTNVVIGPDGTTVMDLAVGSSTRFYRTVTGPAGFVWIKPGTFLMGSPVNEPGRKTDEIQHTVTLTQGYWMSDHEVTQEEYQAVMGSNPSFFNGTELPVERVTWNEAAEYCRKLTEQEMSAGRLASGRVYRLPTEAQWEYAARAGTTGSYAGDLNAMAWYDSNSDNKTHIVKTKLPNAWGLYDMSGNVWEWCSDSYGDYPSGAVIDPFSPNYSGDVRVVRGGGWDANAILSRINRRGSGAPNFRHGSNGGFRSTLSSDQ